MTESEAIVQLRLKYFTLLQKINPPDFLQKFLEVSAQLSTNSDPFFQFLDENQHQIEDWIIKNLAAPDGSIAHPDVSMAAWCFFSLFLFERSFF